MIVFIACCRLDDDNKHCGASSSVNCSGFRQRDLWRNPQRLSTRRFRWLPNYL
jgi:hypothetical protein